MKPQFVSLIVGTFFTLGLGGALAASGTRGGLTPQDLYGVYVQDVTLDTTQLSETITLIDLSCAVPPPTATATAPSASSQLRPGGDGPIPIRHRLCGGDGSYQLALDLSNASDRRVHQLVLTAQTSGSPMNFMFNAGGAIAEVDLTGTEVITVPITTRGHLQVSELDNVAIDGIQYDATKNAASVSLSTAPVCNDDGPVAASRAPMGCGSPSTPMAMALDLTAENDSRSFGVLLSAYQGAALVTLMFSATGDLTSIYFPSAFVENGVNCYAATYYVPVSSYRKAGQAWVPVTSYRASSYVNCAQPTTR
jgi:hypothetical protein